MPVQIPAAPEAEAAIVGAVMLRNDVFDADGVSDLQPYDFCTPRHAWMWAAIRTLLVAGQPVDPVTLEQQLRTDGTLGGVGGLEGVGGFADRFAVTHNVSAHARIVAAKSRARRAQRIMLEQAERLGTADADTVDPLVAETQLELSSIESTDSDGLLTFGDIAKAAIDTAKARNRGEFRPFSFGLTELDALFNGGMLPGRLVVVAARPAMGKTVVGMQVAFEAAARGETPLVFSLEMLKEQLGQRAIATRGEVDMSAVQVPRTESHWVKMGEARDYFAKLGSRVWARPIHLDRLVSVARRWARKTRRKGPIVVDYLQLLTVIGQGRLDANERVSIITRTLKILAMELEVPIVLISQLNRDCEKRPDKRPRLSDLRDSGTIEQDADAVVFMYRPVMYDPEADSLAAEAIVAKCRDAVTGTAEILFEGKFSRFLDGSPAPGPGMEWQR